IGVRMVDADQIQFALARFTVGAQQILGAQFVSRRLRSHRDIIQHQRVAHRLVFAVDRADHGATTFIGINSLRVIHHFAPGSPVNPDHYSASQKCSLRYLSAPSHRIVTITPFLPCSYNSFAIPRAATTLPAPEIPTSRPFSRATRLTILWQSSVSIHIFRSASLSS